MAKRFTELTELIQEIKGDTYGKWIIDRENDGTLEHPKHMPFVYYSGAVDKFIYTL